MKRVVRISEQDLSKLISNLINMSLGGNRLDSGETKNLDDKTPSTSTSDDDFYKKVLECLGAKPTKGNMDFMYAWRQAEGAKADFNPFNTTKNMPGTTDYNSAKVKNYKSKEDGIKATCDTLKLGYYTDILNGLKDDVGLYELSRMKSLKTWGTGELLAKVADGYMGGASPKPNPIDRGMA